MAYNILIMLMIIAREFRLPSRLKGMAMKGQVLGTGLFAPVYRRFFAKQPDGSGVCDVREKSPSARSPTTDYEKRVAAQILQYADTVDMHALPDIFHVWSHNYLRPGLEHVFGSSNVTSFYVDAYLAACPPARGRILSIGCGDGTIEVDIAKALRSRGLGFEFVAADLSPILLGKAQAKIAEADLAKHVTAVEVDLNNISLPGPFDMIMAQHALHHIVGLEQLFDFAKATLTDQGIFATQDMIGRNGHQRWPETRAIIEAFWPTLTEKQRYHAQLQRLDLEFRDHDCSTEGFEGIRAQDILPLMLDRLHPLRFFASGGFVDLVVDRGYGHGWDANNEREAATIHWLCKLNDMLLDAGMIKPTIMMAWFGRHPVQERHFRSRSARASVRRETPSWVSGSLASALHASADEPPKTPGLVVDIGRWVGRAADVPAVERKQSAMHRAFYEHDGHIVHKWRHYLSIYDRHLSRFCNSPVRLLEIGVSKGGSLEMWRTYFGDSAVVFGIDIDPHCAVLDGQDVCVRIGSQADPEFLKSVVAEMGGLDIVIDDGSHVAEHQHASFTTLFPLLDPTGVYICEDTHTAYWSEYFGGGYRRKSNFLEVAKRIVDDLHADFHSRPQSVENANRTIKGVHFYNSMVVIEKEPQASPTHLMMPPTN